MYLLSYSVITSITATQCALFSGVIKKCSMRFQHETFY